ncbi:MAG: hypothetical protein ACRD2N_09410 [Vicinamibacterales bacterium]
MNSSLLTDLGRQVLATNDGFAAVGDGTTGGAGAADSHVFSVRNRAELAAALNAGPTLLSSTFASITPTT